MKDHFEHHAALFLVLDQHMHHCRRGLSAVQLHAGLQLDELILADGRADGHAVDLVDVIARMHDLVGKFAVVGEDQQALAVLVEPADGIDARADVLDQLGDAFPVALVVHGRDEAARLVEHDVAVLRLGRDDAPAADEYLILIGHLVAEHGDLAVDFDLALQNQFLRLAP